MIAAIVVAAVLAPVVAWLWWDLTRLRRKLEAVPEDGDVFRLIAGLEERIRKLEHHAAFITPRLKQLEKSFPATVQHTAVVAYDAFDEMAGRLSRSVALLDANGDGVVLSLLVGRETTRWFAKGVRDWTSAEPLSPEEMQAIGAARGGR